MTVIRPVMGLVALASVMAACTPPCGQLCRKVLYTCELDSERVALDDCENSCSQQLDLYRRWQDEELIELFEQHRRCIARSSCEEIAAGECYEGYERLFVFDPDKPDKGLPPVSLPEPEDSAGDTASE
jgi:hypothetical protein